MDIVARVRSTAGTHEASVGTDGRTQLVAIAGKAGAPGSSVNGGELLMLALATCYCNDLYREAKRLGIPVDGVEVAARADFPGIGLAATNIRYAATVQSSASSEDIARLLRETDAVAEVHNTLRAGVAVSLCEHAAEP